MKAKWSPPTLETLTERYTRFILRRCDNNITCAARLLGISRRTLQRHAHNFARRDKISRRTARRPEV